MNITPQQGKATALTIKSTNGLCNVLYTPVAVALPGSNQLLNFTGLWDTGASGSVITQDVVDALNLKPIGIATVNTASEHNVRTLKFLIDIYLNNDLVVQNVTVTLGKISPEFQLLIGMDIITHGDFSVTNYNKVTCMSFRVPSSHTVDYVTSLNLNCTPVKTAVNNTQKQGQNEPCKCGSGKKYKRCCGAA